MEDWKNISKEITKKIACDINTKLDNLVVEGLKNKGFEFDNEVDLHSFIRQNCIATQTGFDKIFYANKVPFLLFVQENKVESVYIDGEFNMKASIGSYAFL